MHRRTLFHLALLLAFVLGALQGPALQPAAVAAIPPPPSGTEQAALLLAEAPTTIVLTDFDVRFHALAVDGAGQIFVAAPFPGSKIRICRLHVRLVDGRLVEARLVPIYDLPGLKHASVELAVLSDGGLLITWSNRREEGGAFPLEATILPGIATPQSGFGALMPQVMAGVGK